MPYPQIKILFQILPSSEPPLAVSTSQPILSVPRLYPHLHLHTHPKPQSIPCALQLHSVFTFPANPTLHPPGPGPGPRPGLQASSMLLKREHLRMEGLG